MGRLVIGGVSDFGAAVTGRQDIGLSDLGWTGGCLLTIGGVSTFGCAGGALL